MWEELGARYQDHGTVTLARIDITANDIQLLYLDRYPFFQLFPADSQQVRAPGTPAGRTEVTSAIPPGSGPAPAQFKPCFPLSPRGVPRLTPGVRLSPRLVPDPIPGARWRRVFARSSSGTWLPLGAASVGYRGRALPGEGGTHGSKPVAALDTLVSPSGNAAGTCSRRRFGTWGGCPSRSDQLRPAEPGGRAKRQGETPEAGAGGHGQKGLPEASETPRGRAGVWARGSVFTR